MSENHESTNLTKTSADNPILQLYRQNYVKVSGKILDTTEKKLNEYIRFATGRMKTEITSGDVIEHALKLLFERDSSFRNWLKQNV